MVKDFSNGEEKESSEENRDEEIAGKKAFEENFQESWLKKNELAERRG